MKFWGSLTNTQKVISAVAAIAVLSISTYTGIDNWKADALELRQFKKTYECNQMRAERNDVRERLWWLEKQFGEGCRLGNEENKTEFHKLSNELLDLGEVIDSECDVRKK